jgi:hypothetical protein
MHPTTIRVLGALGALGAIVWAVGWLQAGVPPEGTMDQIELVASGVFQLGLLGLLAVMRATKATGVGRLGRFVINAEIVAVLLAFAWTVPFALDPDRPHTTFFVVLDVFWPLSMLGTLVVGIAVLLARRWPMPARVLPLVAGLLIPIDIVLMATGLVGDWGEVVIRSAYFAVAYTALGIAVATQVAPQAGIGDTSVQRRPSAGAR